MGDTVGRQRALIRLGSRDANIVGSGSLFWWISVTLSAVLAFVGAALFYSLYYDLGFAPFGFLWPVGIPIGIVAGLYLSRLFKRLRTRAILPALNGIISLVVLMQAIIWFYSFDLTDASAFLGFSLLIPLTVVSLLSFWKKLAVPVWVICHQAINLFTLIVLSFSWCYWSQSYISQGACMAGMSTPTRIDSVYFTLTTLATVGYGDIHPASEACREVVSWQIIASSIFVIIILSLLVSRIGESASSPPYDQELLGAIHLMEEKLEGMSKDIAELRINLESGGTGEE